MPLEHRVAGQPFESCITNTRIGSKDMLALVYVLAGEHAKSHLKLDYYCRVTSQ